MPDCNNDSRVERNERDIQQLFTDDKALDEAKQGSVTRLHERINEEKKFMMDNHIIPLEDDVKGIKNMFLIGMGSFTVACLGWIVFLVVTVAKTVQALPPAVTP